MPQELPIGADDIGITVYHGRRHTVAAIACSLCHPVESVGIWKAVAGASVLTVFFLKHRKVENVWTSVLPALITASAADLVMTYAFLPGAALFLVGHVLLVICFMKKARMSRGQWIQWGILSLLVSGLIIWQFPVWTKRWSFVRVGSTFRS